MERWRGRSNQRSRRNIRSSRNNSNGLGLLFLAVTISSCWCGALGVTECSRIAPYFLTADQRAALCRQAHTSAPADCARKARTAPGFTGPLIVELCSGAVSDLPGVCVASMSRSIATYLSPALRIEVCTGAHSDVSQNIWSGYQSSWDLVLCCTSFLYSLQQYVQQKHPHWKN